MRNIVHSNIVKKTRLVLSYSNRISYTYLEMMTLIGCLEKFGRDQSMCVDEINQFNQCYVKFQQVQEEVKRNKEKGALPKGAYAKFNGPQMTEYIKKFPLSQRTRQSYVHPKVTRDK